MKFFSSLRSLFRKKSLDADMAEEMRQHLERRVEANLSAGMSADEARFAAQRQFGGVEQLKEIARDQRGWSWFENFARDLSLAVRQLGKSPGFTAATLLVLVLGIGGVTAMFSTLYSVMIRPLPYPEAERLVMGVSTFSGAINPNVAGPDYLDYREQSRSFTALEAFFCQTFEVSLRQGQSTERVDCLLVSTGLFDALGVNMTLGRRFTAQDGEAKAAPAAIVSHAYWRQHLGSEKDLARLTILVDGVPRALVGVTSPDFQFISKADVWLPQTPPNLGPRRYHNWLLVGRLKKGTALAGAQSEVDLISARLEKAYPETNTGMMLLLVPLQGGFTDQYRRGFILLCGGAGAVLLIACANAAGLLLARGAGRRGELAVRAALGASPWQIMQVLLAEALLLAVAAGGLGTVLALWIQSGLVRLFSVEEVFLRDTGFSWPVLGFVLAVTLLTGLGSSLLPAWHARHPDLVHALKSLGKGGTRQSSRLRGGLVATQVGVSFVLLVVAGLLGRSFVSLHSADAGFDPKNLLTVEVPLPPLDYNGQRRTQFFESLLTEIRALPGVRSAAAIDQLPLRDPANDVGIFEAGAPPATPATGIGGYQRVVLPGYFETMKIPQLAGRDVRSSDTRTSARVVVISQLLAERLFPGRDPLGRKVVIDGAVQTPWEVVGVVGDIKASRLQDDLRFRGAFYRPHGQSTSATMRLAIRTSISPHALVPPLRALVQKMDPHVPLSGPRTMEDVMVSVTRSEKAQTLTLTIFSLLAVVLAAVGLYGVLAYRVTQLRPEIGIRMALGASHRQIAWSILRQACELALIGAAAGALGALGISRLMSATLHGVAPQDPVTFATATLVLVSISGLAAWLPARRASRINPMEALRAE